ncbi:hypothetical protein [uncultured Methanobrevibacter sp.]|nr:hypothetical protein [uncultured Methanobrevibacter sp.]
MACQIISKFFSKININLQPGVYIINSDYGLASLSNKVTVTSYVG